jgi:hypothetical protein
VAWNASALNSETKQQGVRMEKLEKQLDTLIHRFDQPGPRG